MYSHLILAYDTKISQENYQDGVLQITSIKQAPYLGHMASEQIISGTSTWLINHSAAFLISFNTLVTYPPSIKHSESRSKA